MRQASRIANCDLVLVGGGHSHVEVLRQFALRSAPDIRVTLISRDIHTPYSGMLPGFVAGHYSHDDAHIDLRPLALTAGARLFHSEAVGLDLAGRRVICADRPPVQFDCLSLDIGSKPDWKDVPGAAGHALPIKPVDGFVAGWRAIEQALQRRCGSPFRIVVVGGGAGGTEICLALQHRVATRLQAGSASPPRVQFAIVADAAELVPSHNAGVRRRLTRAVRQRGIELYLDRRVVAVTPDALRCWPDGEIPFDAAIWVTNAAPAAWLCQSGLATDEQGFVIVSDRLQSTSHPFVFATGDVAALVGHRLAKSGVFAVREGPPLARNLRRACRGEALGAYRPQRHHLALISTGDKYAIASRGRWSAAGAFIWRLKDHIDRRWMRMYRDLDGMNRRSAPRLGTGAATPEMHCGGCGAKVGSELLGRVLRRLQPPGRPDVIVGLDPADDAAVVTVSGNELLVQSVDFFRAFIDDPYLFGRIAANHCLGDLYAMGASPRTALAIVTLAYGPDAQREADLLQLLSGATETLTEAGAVLVGGHTGEGPELAFGLTVNGAAAPDRLWRKSGLQVGDRLVLTKPLGTGALFAADMRAKARGDWIDAALRTMLTSNRVAAEVFRRHVVTTCTDVTGFGLVGHLLEMLRASAVDARLSLAAVPVLDGALDVLGQGIASSLAPQNRALSGAVDVGAAPAADPRVALLYDPQTAGGLLAGVPADSVDACLSELRSSGVAQAACVGHITRSAAGAPGIVLAP
ncbi:MAG: selenide, water dikinase SelD [Dongiaceae bacterium]